ncbi:MATE family efflux transporter [Cohaesibacter celericrescens]|uniref:MATE family efflux transporter n=1 Tax=Cohaesibacter celericrescens TaxID=2067669 RepID=A0A2N5XK19_9HYPH|nr:MATE family efflux transporter [Cohaesibacter celericrescens]PLW74869.1 MATE family efflux transporter [Cohaesibacter celericrescens]
MTSNPDQNLLAFDVTHKMVLGIAIPMTLGLVTVPLVGIVDMAVIGQLGSASLMGGIAVGALMFDVVAASCNFLRMGTTGLTAQAVGAGDEISQRAVVYRAFMLAALIGFVVLALAPFVTPWALGVMGGSDAVNVSAKQYLLIRLYAMPFTLANFAIFGWLFGLGKSRTAMVLLILLNSTNILLTIWFVLGLDMGVEGAALGTVAGEVIAVLMGFGIMAYHLRDNWRVPLPRLFNQAAFLRFLALNRDIFIRSMVMLVAFALFTSLSARQNDDILAANELLMHFFMFGGFFLDGIATAAEQLGGRATGANYRPAFDKTVRLTLVWGIGLGAGLSLLMWTLGPFIIDALTTAPGVRSLSRDYLVWAALTPLIATLAFQMDGIFIGATWSSSMRNISILATGVFVLAEMVFMPLLGNDGLWLAMLAFLTTRGLGLSLLLPGRISKTFAIGSIPPT